MRKTLYIMCGVACVMAMASCAPKATSEGVPADGDTVEVTPTLMQHPADTVVADTTAAAAQQK